MYEYHCRVSRILDGDTVEVDIDLGFDVWYTHPCRLAGINAPELATPDGPRAKIKLATLLLDKDGVTVVTTLLKSGDQRAEKYGRVLGTFWLNGTNINQQLLDEGFAVPYMVDRP